MQIVDRHPDIFDKSTESNISRFWMAIHDCLQGVDGVTGLFEALNDVEASKKIDTATGRQLDLIGEDVGQPRITSDDEYYRLLIKSRIQANISPGDLNSLERFISVLLDVPLPDVTITETDPATIYISVPIGTFTGALTVDRFMVIMHRVKPAGVGFLLFVEGTFQFADDDVVQINEDEGFADDEQNIGGELSYIE